MKFLLHCWTTEPPFGAAHLFEVHSDFVPQIGSTMDFAFFEQKETQTYKVIAVEHNVCVGQNAYVQEMTSEVGVELEKISKK